MKYYLHDSNARNDEKTTLLFIKYGYEGLGLFYSILEILSAQEKPVNELVLKSQLNIKKRLEQQLLFMYEIELLSIKNGDVFNENILNFSEKYQIKKEKTRKKISEWREKQRDVKNVTSNEAESNTPKVKLSKVKESKRKLTPWEIAFNDYKEMRKKIRRPLTNKAEVIAINKLNDFSMDKQEQIKILEQSVFNSWQGLFELKKDLNNKPNKINEKIKNDPNKNVIP